MDYLVILPHTDIATVRKFQQEIQGLEGRIVESYIAAAHSPRELIYQDGVVLRVEVSASQNDLKALAGEGAYVTPVIPFLLPD